MSFRGSKASANSPTWTVSGKTASQTEEFYGTVRYSASSSPPPPSLPTPPYLCYSICRRRLTWSSCAGLHRANSFHCRTEDSEIQGFSLATSWGMCRRFGGLQLSGGATWHRPQERRASLCHSTANRSIGQSGCGGRSVASRLLRLLHPRQQPSPAGDPSDLGRIT